jgi:flagellum-specific ATP synthase
MAAYSEAKDLIDIGAYQKGSNAVIDYAISLHQPINAFLRQQVEEPSDYEQTVMKLHALFSDVSTIRG